MTLAIGHREGDVVVIGLDDVTFTRDRLHEASKRLAERVEALKALEADRLVRAEHKRIATERNRLAEEMEGMVEPIAQIANLVSRIDASDREIGCLNSTSASKFGRIRPVLAGASPVISTPLGDAIVLDAFILVVRLGPAPTADKSVGPRLT
jgi:hypothetical protein